MIDSYVMSYLIRKSLFSFLSVLLQPSTSRILNWEKGTDWHMRGLHALQKRRLGAEAGFVLFHVYGGSRH